tara:strand:- start:351 stop:707 length:357 start_codon:yes stop_codon:yes gene_type:complete
MELIAESVMDITSVIINEDSSMICFEGTVGKYGRVYANHTYIPNGTSKDAGKFYGEARTIMEDGTMVSASLQGVFRRSGGKISILSLDDASNGDQNYVRIEIDLLEKKSKVSVYDAWT